MGRNPVGILPNSKEILWANVPGWLAPQEHIKRENYIYAYLIGTTPTGLVDRMHACANFHSKCTNYVSKCNLYGRKVLTLQPICEKEVLNVN